MDFPGFLVLPISPKLKRKVKLDSPGTGAIIGTATAVPALFGMQDNRRLALLRMGYIYIDLACFYTYVTSVANLRIEKNRIVRCRNIRNSEHFFLRHFILQKIN